MQAIAKSVVRDFFSAFGGGARAAGLPGGLTSMTTVLDDADCCAAEQHVERRERPPRGAAARGLAARVPLGCVELRRFRELARFGCGCIWEDRLGYVPVERTRES